VQAEYTIDELARVADTTVRSVRVYHERGLLPSPEVRGRIGYYGAEHLNRLQTISRLLSRGMKLNGIRELLDAWDRGDGLAEVLGVTHTPTASPAGTLTATTYSDRAHDPTTRIERVLDNTPFDSGAASQLSAFRVTNPHCTDLTDRLVAVGLAPEASTALVEQLRRDCDRIADRYAGELLYCLAGQSYEMSERTAEDRTKLHDDIAGARQVVTRAISELIEQSFARRTANP
jgi:DNA-binding transcriptional MerR regulator